MKNKLLFKALAYSKKNKSVIGVRKYGDDSEFYVGYIIDFSDELIFLQHLTKYGVEDGIIVLRTEDIESFETEDDYVKAIQYLFDHPEKLPKQSVKALKAGKYDGWQYHFLKAVFSSNSIITIEINKGELETNGFILDFDEAFLKLQPISNTGASEGENFYKLEDITSISINKLESRKREALFLRNKK